jgi:hypothetical protein
VPFTSVRLLGRLSFGANTGFTRGRVPAGVPSEPQSRQLPESKTVINAPGMEVESKYEGRSIPPVIAEAGTGVTSEVPACVPSLFQSSDTRVFR